jgi:hypothetical protein
MDRSYGSENKRRRCAVIISSRVDVKTTADAGLECGFDVETISLENTHSILSSSFSVIIFLSTQVEADRLELVISTLKQQSLSCFIILHESTISERCKLRLRLLSAGGYQKLFCGSLFCSFFNVSLFL